MRQALIVGIDHYKTQPLAGCVSDAENMYALLRQHENNDPNFQSKIVTSSGDGELISRAKLREDIATLFTSQADVALLYFSGHGFLSPVGGYFVTQDASRYDEGISMDEVLNYANQSPSQEKVIIIDCCHSGAFGTPVAMPINTTALKEGVSIIAASRANQASSEVNGSGLFTSSICDGLKGGASDVLGGVTAANLYAYVDEALGAWTGQRPVFRTNVSRFVSLRQNHPIVALENLRLLSTYFSTVDSVFALDPSFEFTHPEYNPENGRIFQILQKYRAARLVEPIGTEHLYYAAIESRACKLTFLGQRYWKLASEGRL